MPVISIAGHVCADLIPELTDATAIAPGQLIEIGPLRIEPGGCVANTGVALAALGATVRISASIGDDDLGRIVRQLLTDRGLDASGLAVGEGTSTSYSIVVEKPGENRSFWHHVGANAAFDGTTVSLDGIDLLHVGYPPLLPALTADGGAPLMALLERARAAGVTTSVDLAVVDRDSPAGRVDWRALLANTLPLVDVISPSVDDLVSALDLPSAPGPDEIRELARMLVEQGAGIVVLSAGPDGLFLRAASGARLRSGGGMLAALAEAWADAELWVPAVPLAQVVTTNGAGDAASAGLLHALVDGLPPAEALDRAANVAATVIRGERIRPITV